MAAFESERIMHAYVQALQSQSVRSAKRLRACFGRGYLYQLVQVLKREETQKWRVELLESVEAAVTESFV